MIDYFFESMVPIVPLMALFMCVFTIVYMQLLLSKRTEFKDLRKESIRFISQWNSPELVKVSMNVLNYETIKKLRRMKEDDEIVKLENYQDIITILNFMEEMALYIDNRLVNERILRKYFSQIVFEIYKTLEIYIEILRDERRNPTLYRQFEKLVNIWMFSNNQ